MKTKYIKSLFCIAPLAFAAHLNAGEVVFSESFEGSFGIIKPSSKTEEVIATFTAEPSLVTDKQQAAAFTNLPPTPVGQCGFYQLFTIESTSLIGGQVKEGHTISLDVKASGFTNTTGQDSAYTNITLSMYELSTEKFTEKKTVPLEPDSEEATKLTYTFSAEDAAKFASGGYVMLSLYSNYGGWQNGASSGGNLYVDNLKILSN